MIVIMLYICIYMYIRRSAAWQQPQFVSRAGLYHSVYGTYDYRAGIYDLRDGRGSLQDLIGAGAEELAFAICTSDRLGLLRDLMVVMYGEEHVTGYGLLVNIRNDETDKAKRSTDTDTTTTTTSSSTTTTTTTANVDGNPYPKLKCMLGADGFPVTNHITSTKHVLPSRFFAHFIIVFAADFMDQGALPFGSSDLDVCLFQFLRFRFFSDVIRFVSPYLEVIPPVQLHIWCIFPHYICIYAYLCIYVFRCSSGSCGMRSSLSPRETRSSE
jgi:hypothetical protein